MRSAAISIAGNIAEGFGRYSDKEFIRFLEISQSSATEVISITYVLEDLEMLTNEQVQQIRSKTHEAKNQTLALIKYLKNKKNKLYTHHLNTQTHKHINTSLH